MTFVPVLGESDFRKLRESGGGYIDKTGFICDVLNDTSPALLFPRPRRFGKTINLSALGYFLRKTDESLAHLYEGLAVSRDPKAMRHFGKYPTLLITFKDVKAASFEESLATIGARVQTLFEEHKYLLREADLHAGQVLLFERILTGHGRASARKSRKADSHKKICRRARKRGGNPCDRICLGVRWEACMRQAPR